jgi:histidyl-tRNA synthetase
MGIKYTVNPTIVRGLDYYTKTVFEFVSTEIGAQGTVCGGGRYDGLVKEVGGPDTPALGFGMGIERLMLLMENQGLNFPEASKCELYIATMGEKATLQAAAMANALRREGMFVEFDVVGRSVKAQMKYANKIGAKFTVVIGDSELESGIEKLKNMESGEEQELSLATFESDILNITISESLKEFDNLDFSAIMG